MINRGHILTLLASLALLAPVTAHAAVAEGEITDAIAATCRAHLALSDSSRLEVHSVRVSRSEVLEAAQGVNRVELPPGMRGQGHITAKIFLDIPGSEGTWVWTSARVAVEVPTVVNIRPLTRGQNITHEDVAMMYRPAQTGLILSIEDAVGQVARRNLSPQRALRTSNLRRPQMLRRGDQVDAVIRSASLSVRTSGIVMESGGHHDLVRVKIASTGRVVNGRIMNNRLVEVTP